MNGHKQEVWLQITAGQGPAECALAAVKVIQEIEKEAVQAGLECRTIEIQPGPEPGTALSALISISPTALAAPSALQAFAESWSGTVQWIGRSPFRPTHKRKNWFVAVDLLEPPAEECFNPNEVRWDTMRASGPGGQHVNRTESAVRVIHIATGLQATASEERSQHRNRKLALARLIGKLDAVNSDRRALAEEKRWRAHRELERGNPVRILTNRTR